MFKSLFAISLLATASLAQTVSVNVNLGALAYSETCPAPEPGTDVSAQVPLFVRVDETLTGNIATVLSAELLGAVVSAQVGVCLCPTAVVDAGLPLSADVVAALEAQIEAAAEVALNVNRISDVDVTLTPGETDTCNCPAGATPTCSGTDGCGCDCPNGEYDPTTGLCPPAPSGRYRHKRLSPEDFLLAPRQAKRSEVVARLTRRHT